MPGHALIQLHRHAQRATEGLEHGFDLVVGVGATQVVDVQADQGVIDEALEEFLEQIHIETADHRAGERHVHLQAWTTGEVDDHARQRLREFLRWHVGFWCRYAPQRPDGSWPSMQTRESASVARSPLEALLSRDDEAALDYVTDQLIAGGDFADPPAKSAAPSDRRDVDRRDADPRDAEGAAALQDLVAG